MKRILKFLSNLILIRYKPKIIGVTGNVGKTSTKKSIEAVLSHNMKVRSSSDNFPNELSIIMTVLGSWKEEKGRLFWLRVVLVSFFKFLFKSRKYPEILIIEYNVDRPGDMQKLLDIVRPEIGVVTAIGKTPTHIEFFTDKEALIREKAKLVNQLPATGFSFLNIDDPEVYGMSDRTRSHVISFGFSKEADLKITSFENSVNSDFKGITFKLNYGGSFIPVRIKNVLGEAPSYAAAIAAGVGIIFDMNLVDISESLSTYDSPPGRLKVLDGIKKSIIIDDSYNSSPLAVREALSYLKIFESKRKIAVLGDILELGKYTLEIHEDIGKIASNAVDMLITTGMRGKFISKSAIDSGMDEDSVYHFDTVEEAALFLQGKIKQDDVVLIKASENLKFENIVEEVMADPENSDKLLVSR